MFPVKQSASLALTLFAYDSSGNGVTGKVDGDWTKRISKNGAAFGAMTVTITEMENGWYSFTLSSSHSDTLGVLSLSFSATGVQRVNMQFRIEARTLDDLAYPATSGRSMVVDASGLVDANAVKIGPTGSGTAQTARDIGASVLLSSGTGTGQLDFTSGVVKANLAQILGTALTETAGQIAAAFKKFFDKASPTGTINSIPDAVAGASGGLFIAGSNAATTANITGNLSGSVGSVTSGVTVSTNNDKTGYALTTLESQVLQSGTAQAGAAGTITLASGASATDSLYVGEIVKIYGGAGAGQVRVITAYVGATKVATVGRNWTTAPDNTSTYAVLALSVPKVNDSLEVVASSVTGAVASVTGNVGGNVVGSVGNVASGGIAASSFAAGAIDAAAIAADAIGSSELAASAVTEIQSAILSDATPFQGARIDAAITSRLATASYTAPPSAATIAAAVWDYLTSAAVTAGSFGKRIVDFLTGDIYARLGAPAGASIAADIAGVQADTDNIQTRLPATLVSGRIDASVGAMATDVLTAAALAASAVTEIQSGLSTLDAAGVRTALGLSSANLDTQLAAIAAYIDTEVAAIKAKTDNLPASPAAVGSAMTLTSGERDSIAAAGLDLANGVETGLTERQALRLMVAALAGKLSGAATTTVVIRNAVADSKDRITATVDADGNRSAVTVDVS